MPHLRKGYADSPHGQVHFVELGSGEPLVLLGPAPRSYRVFLELAGALSGRFRCIIVDQLGFGESAPLPEGGTMEDVADAVPPVLDALGIESAHFFGLHSGLKIAAAVAARHPGRVDGLVLCGKSHSIAPDMEIRNRATRTVVDRYYFSDGAGPSAEGSAIRAWSAQWRNLTAAWWSDTVLKSADSDAMMAATEAKIIDDLMARRAIQDSYRANFAFDLGAAVRKITSPLTVIEFTSKAEDARIGRQGQALADLVEGGRSVALAETDPTGLRLYVGIERLAAAIADSLANAVRA